MQQQRIAITGASGAIGSVLVPALRGHKLSRYSLPWTDLRRYANARRAFRNQDVIIHLAWDLASDNSATESCSAGNTAMFLNVYKAALENKVRRVIMASSVHVEDFYHWSGPELLSVDRTASPATLYGAHKLFMESVGLQYSRMGLEVVCLRFGGLQKNNMAPQHLAAENAVFLSREDCISLVKALLAAPKIPDGFSIVYGVSDGPNRMHDITNPFGWNPTAVVQVARV